MMRDGGDRFELTPAGYHQAANNVEPPGGSSWPHSFNSQDQSWLAWDGEHWAAPGVVPSLVLELALSQLRSLLAEASRVSSVWAAEAVAAEADSELRHEDDAERP